MWPTSRAPDCCPSSCNARTLVIGSYDWNTREMFDTRMLIATGTRGSTGPSRPSTLSISVSWERRIWSESVNHGWSLLPIAIEIWPRLLGPRTAPLLHVCRTWLRQRASNSPPELPAVPTMRSGRALRIEPRSRTTSTNVSRALSSSCAIVFKSGLLKFTREIPVEESWKLPLRIRTSGRFSTWTDSELTSFAYPPRCNVESYERESIRSVPATMISVEGGAAGLTGRVRSFSLAVTSPEKFFIAIMNDKRSGISPGRFTLPGASPIMVKMALISSGGSVPEGSPRIQSFESVVFPNVPPSIVLLRSSK